MWWVVGGSGGRGGWSSMSAVIMKETDSGCGVGVAAAHGETKEETGP